MIMAAATRGLLLACGHDAVWSRALHRPPHVVRAGMNPFCQSGWTGRTQPSAFAPRLL